MYRRLGEPALVTTLLTRTVEAFRAPNGGRTASEIWLRAALLEIERQDALPAIDKSSHDRRQAIERVCAEIARQPGRSYRVATLAKRLHCSPDHFARLFRRIQGVTPGEFVIRCRVESAKTMLRESSLPITRLAELLGYRDVYYFSKQFRQRTGLTPTQFRKD